MIDLHLHLDGSLAKEDFIYLLKKEGLPLPNDFPDCIYVPDDCPSLKDYLKRFDLPCSLMQSKDNLTYITKSLVNRLYALGYIYAEIRFAPLLHTFKGLNQREVVESVLKGIEEGLVGKQDFNVNLILCLMRGFDEKMNLETIKVMKEMNNPRIVSLDLAGSEKDYPNELYLDLFKIAANYGLNFIIHAGEARGDESVMSAIKMGAKRIGHGIHLDTDNPQSVEIAKSIGFEFCPTSNLQTKSLLSYKDVPLLAFKKHGIMVSINADNMTVSNTDVIQEFRHLVNAFQLTKEDVKEYLYNSVYMSFTSKEEKENMYRLVDTRLNDFYQKLI